MNLEMLRRVSAGLFVLMMGVVAALPYQTTTPLARRRSAASSDDAFASDWGPGSDISVEAPTVAGQFASPPSQPSFWRRTTPSAAPPPTHPMLVLDPEQPARPVMDVEAPPAPTRLVKTSPRPSEMDAPPTPSMSPTFPDTRATPAPPPVGVVTQPAARVPATPQLWDAEMTPVPHRDRHLQVRGPVDTEPPATRSHMTQPRTITGQPFPGLTSHKIRDGDTLANIAQRKLGDARRAGEIYELNRNILPSPAVLPVGVNIVLPPQDQQLPQEMTPVVRH